MKSILGLKEKASQAVKQRIDQAKERAAAGNNQSVQKPFESTVDGRSSPGRAEDNAVGTPPSPAPATLKGAAKSGNTSPQSPGKQVNDTGVIKDVDPALDYLLHNARSEAVRQEFLKTPPGDYTTTHAVKLLAGTYNVNGRLPPPTLDLKPWIDAASSQADVVAVAFQEIVPLNAQNVVMGASLEAATTWEKLIDAALNGNSDSQERQQHSEDGQFSSTGLTLSDLNLADASPAGVGGKADQEDAVPNEGEADLEGYLSPAEDLASIISDEHLAGLKPYVQVAGKQMVGIYLSVWVKRGLLPNIRGVQATSVGTGIMGYLGNKGAVAVRLRVFDSGLTIIAAHLSSGEQEGDELKRNYDYSEIVRRGAFPPDVPSLDHDSLASNVPSQPDSKPFNSGSMPGQWGEARSLMSSEHTVWMGDLNYRLSMPDAEARAAIKAGRLEEVAEWDELTNMIRQKRAFQGWQEGRLTFPPTFKFRRGTDVYLGDEDEDAEHLPEQSALSVASSTAPSVTGTSPNGQAGRPEGAEKRRTPAWTDRVLWRPHDGIKQLSYSSAGLSASDHKPVVATFSVVAKQYLHDKIEAAIDAARRTVDAQETARLPRCDLEPSTIDIGRALYAREKQTHIILSNKGLVKAHWQFMPLPGAMFGDPADSSLRPAPRWAHLEPSEGTLEPGRAVEIILTIRIDGGKEGTAELLTGAPDRKLDAILVLRVQEGNDIFCSISGVYQPSFFGLPLEVLATLPRPLIPPETLGLGSPKLRINTRQRPRQRNQLGSDGPPVEFFSPVSSFHESPTSATATDPDTLAFRQSRIASTASVASDPEHESSAMTQQPEDVSVAESSPPPATGLPHGHALPASEDDGDPTARLLPPELVEITRFLQANGRLKTPGLFVNSLDLAHAASPRPPGARGAGEEEDGSAVSNLREALDRGEEIPETASVQDVAATLLAFFCALPSPLMPAAAAQVCDYWAPPKAAAASLLGDTLSPAELAVFRHSTGLLMAALAPENCEENGLTREVLASLFSEVWFERLPLGLRAAGEKLRPADVTELQRLADDVDRVSERRSAFVAVFLEPGEEE